MKSLVNNTTRSLQYIFRFVINLALFPVRLLYAQEQRTKLRSLDVALLRDVGLTQNDVDRATLNDFIRKKPR